MLKYGEWSTTIPHVIYQSFPDSDALLIRPPRMGETIEEFSAAAREQQSDLLFQYVCEEARTAVNANEYRSILDCAISDILSVRDAVRKMPACCVRKRLASSSRGE